MLWLWMAAAVLLLIFVGAYVCWRMAFFVSPRERGKLLPLPASEQYAPFAELSSKMLQAAVALPYEDIWTVSREGLRLHGKYYAGAPGAPVQIMFHGYRSSAERDFCGGLQAAIHGGFHILLVDQRAHGESEGSCLTFGVKERFDCLCWAEYAAERFGPDCSIFLYGMSMGAATALMAAALPLPRQVVGIVADCGYSAPSDILRKVIRDRGLPCFPVYGLLRLGARLFGRFDPEEASPRVALEQCSLPVLLIHGGDDRFVPCEMSRENFRHCAAENKHLLIVPGAGHGISYLLDSRGYLEALADFTEGILHWRPDMGSGFPEGVAPPVV